MSALKTPQPIPGTAWLTAATRFGDPDSITVDAWNAAIKPTDIVWIIGGLLDPHLSGADVGDMLELVAALNGSKYLIAGPDDHPFHGHGHGKLMLDRWTQRYHDEGGLTGVVTGAATAKNGTALRMPLMGGLPFGNPVVLLSALAYADTPGVPASPYRPQPPGRAKSKDRRWLLHGEPGLPAADPERQQLNVGLAARGALPVSATDVIDIIAGLTGSPSSAAREEITLL